MKKILTFIPLGIGISAAIIYIFNIISFRAINNTVAMGQILSNLKMYLYVSIVGFLFYLLVKVIILLNNKSNMTKDDEVVESINNSIDNLVVKNNSVVTNEKQAINLTEEEPKIKAYEPFEVEENNDIKEIVIKNNCCPKCGGRVYEEDIFCKTCGRNLKRKIINPVIKNMIDVLEIVILILIIYFSLNMLFDYKENHDSSFKSPFKINMTK